MKHLALLLSIFLISLGLATISCRGTKSASLKKTKVTVEDHSSEDFRFEVGVFYSFHFPESFDEHFSESAQIQALTDAGIRFTDLWFKRGSRSCRPPGSNQVMMVVVEPSLLIRLDKPDLNLIPMGYTETSEPGLGNCAYSVKHYHRY